MKYRKVVRDKKKYRVKPALYVTLFLLLVVVCAVFFFLRLEKGREAPSSVPSAVSSAPVSSEVVSSEPVSSEPVSSEPVSSEPVSSAPLPAFTEINGLLVVGDTAYEYYNYVRSTAEQYTAAINKLAGQLNGTAKVYAMIVPTSIDVTLEEGIRAQAPVSDQKDSISKMYNMLDLSVTPIPVLNTLLAHKDEYLYFRTDHHWTAQAAYYAYEEFMKAKGAAPTPLSNFTPLEFPGFLGYFYRTAKSELMVQNPDTVYAYRPKETNALKVTTAAGEEVTMRIVGDSSGNVESGKYLCFIGGDQPYSVIENPRKTDGSTCIVVKESFGNAFVPFLTGNYQTVHIVDYRYFSQVDDRTLSQLAIDTGATEVLFINNISATRNKSIISSLTNLVG